MYCYKCGYNNKDNARYCVKCGTAIGFDDIDRTENTTQRMDDYYEDEDYRESSGSRKTTGTQHSSKRKKGPNKGILILLIVLVAAAAAAAIMLLLMGNKTEIKLSNYLNASIEGTNGEGHVTSTLDVEGIINDNQAVFALDSEKKQQLLNILSATSSYPDDECIEMLFDACVSGSFDKTDGLSNGDKITYRWNIDEEKFQKVFNVTFIAEDLEYKIAGLSEKSTAEASSSEASKEDENGQNESSSETKDDNKTNDDTMSIPTATPTTTPQVKTTATVQTASSTSMNGYSKLKISGATSSVECLVQEGNENSGIDNSAKSAVDGNEVTSWQEGVDGYGIGAYLDLQLESTSSVHAITFKMGNWRDAGQYKDNARPKGITIWLDSQSFSVTIPDGMVEYAVVFSNDVTASDIKVVIDSVYTAEWEDTCISEITVYGK